MRLFKLTSGSDEFAVVLTEDYADHIRKRICDPKILQAVGTLTRKEANFTYMGTKPLKKLFKTYCQSHPVICLFYENDFMLISGGHISNSISLYHLSNSRNHLSSISFYFNSSIQRQTNCYLIFFQTNS